MTLDLARARMIEDHLESRGITQARLLAAFARTPREAFIADELVDLAYEDAPLPIAEEQTISQPYIVAVTVEALALTGIERVLEVGTGSGYAAAILSQMAGEVYSVERHASLAQEARARLARLGYTNVHVLQGDGSLGWPEHAPYDAIAVAASAPKIPPALLEQLGPKGRLVLPVSSGASRQMLLRVTRDHSTFREEKLTAVRFVPLVGEQGYADSRRGAPIAPEETTRRHAFGAPIGQRALVTRDSIEKEGFFVAVETDWPDARAAQASVVSDAAPHGPFETFPFGV